MAALVPCHVCKREIDPDGPNVYRRVTGWEKKATGWTTRKGGSDIVLRQRGDEIACGFCIDNLRNGRPAQQGALL